MLQYMLRRLLALIAILFGVSVIVFLLVHLAPGDPVLMMLGEDATVEEVARIRALMGFDEPLHVQYVRWLGNALQGDLGMSIRQRIPVTELISDRMGATLELAGASILFAVSVGIPLGVFSAVHRGTWVDFGAMIVALIGVSMPNFWIGLILLSKVALHVDWLPLFGRGPAVIEAFGALFTQGSGTMLWDSFRSLLLPSLALGASIMALITRLTRSSVLEVLRMDYVRTARSKGLGERTVVYKHALRNALMPVITVIGVQFGALLGGAITTEVVFAWPGVGRLIVNSISQRDFPIIQGGVLMLAVIFALVNLLVDLSYGLLNPRIRYD